MVSIHGPPFFASKLICIENIESNSFSSYSVVIGIASKLINSFLLHFTVRHTVFMIHCFYIAVLVFQQASLVVYNLDAKQIAACGWIEILK